MYLRIAWGKLRPGTWEEYERHYCEKIVPSDQEFDGLLDRQLLQCAQNPDEGISFSVWDNLEDLDAYESSETHQAFAKKVGSHIILGSQQEEADRYEAMGYLTSLTRKKKGDPELGAAM